MFGPTTAGEGCINASIPTPQPTFYRPQFAAHGRAKFSTSVTFVSAAGLASGAVERLGLGKRVSAVRGTRGITKRDLIWNDVLPKIEVDPGEADVAEAARRGWLLGNLHFPVEVADRILRVADDSALRPVLERERVPFTAAVRVFTPLSSHTHHHGH